MEIVGKDLGETLRFSLAHVDHLVGILAESILMSFVLSMFWTCS